MIPVRLFAQSQLLDIHRGILLESNLNELVSWSILASYLNFIDMQRSLNLINCGEFVK